MAPLNEESVQEIVTEEGQAVQLTPEQKKEQLAQLMSDGKRELRAGNFEAAGQKFGEAAEFTNTQYGEFEAESFEPNFMYGRALVELGAIENDLFENALVNMVKKEMEGGEEDRDGDESMTEEEKEEVREMVADAITENAEELEKKAEENKEKEEKTDEEEKKEEKTEESTEEEKKEEKTEESTEEEKKESADEVATEEKKEEETVEKAADEKMEEGTEKEETNGDEAEGVEEEEDAEKEDIDDGDEEDDEEDVDTNQLAWEALEVAAKIADKMIDETSSDEWKRKKADVFVQLAQCSVNEEKFDTALEDLERARALLTTTESAKGDRLISETYFHDGRILRLRNQYAAAAVAFTKAAEAMEATLAVVKAASGDAPTDDQKQEMEELVEVIKDFKERADDCTGSEHQKKMMEEDKEKEKQPTILSSSNANTDASANDISSLVRKKRAHDESEAEVDPKRSKSEEIEEKGEENIAV